MSDYKTHTECDRCCRMMDSCQCDTAPAHSAPPIGLVPRWIANRNRYDEILEAMDRFREAGRLIPVDWLTELADLSDQIAKDSRGNKGRSTE